AGKNYNVFTIDEGPPPGRVVLDFGDTDLSRHREESLQQENKEQEQKQEKEREKEQKKEREKQEKKEKEKKKDREDSGLWEEIGKTSRKESSTDRQIDEITGLKGKSIAIDAGHGGSDSGAIGPTGVMEKSVTLRIALEVEKLLKEEGATVYMTRTTDTEVSPKGARASDSEELQARCDVANRKKADIFVSIHMDSFTNREAKGTTGYYFSQGSRQGRELADKIRSNLVDQLGTQSRGTQTCNFYVVRHTDMPATLIEVAFISNPEEERLLNSKEGIKKAAMAIVDGIADYFG
ncbi:MAG: N-acetylmuramoyl-L-alanine amidase, partial [Selenomonadaceae bacterium]|nr:N-acetylmuramoyl-L-alanine amidase [Selenomonadaceae bacterium]